MTVRKLTSRQEKVKAFLLDGQTIRQTGDILKLSYHQVRHIADNLEHLGHIRRRVDTLPAVLYMNPKTPPLGGATPKPANSGGSVRLSRGDAEAENHTFRESRVHLNGEIYYKIRNVGRMETIRDKAGFALGDWSSKIGNPNARKDYKGYLNIDGKRITFAYRQGAKGSNTFAVWPADVWTSGEGAKAKGEAVLKDRAKRLTELLYDLGWRFFEQEVRGTFESGHVNNPMVARMDKSHVNTDATVKPDTSPKIPEIEVTDDVANDILSYVPEHILALYASEDKIVKRLDRQDVYVSRMMDLMDKVIAVQQQNTIAMSNATADFATKHNGPEGIYG